MSRYARLFPRRSALKPNLSTQYFAGSKPDLRPPGKAAALPTGLTERVDERCFAPFGSDGRHSPWGEGHPGVPLWHFDSLFQRHDENPCATSSGIVTVTLYVPYNRGASFVSPLYRYNAPPVTDQLDAVGKRRSDEMLTQSAVMEVGDLATAIGRKAADAGKPISHQQRPAPGRRAAGAFRCRRG